VIDPADGPALVGAAVFAHDGTHLGNVDGVSLDPVSRWPRWAHLHTPTGAAITIPLAQAYLTGGALRVPYTAALVHAAPAITVGVPTSAETQLLSAYYGPFDDPTPYPPLIAPTDIAPTDIASSTIAPSPVPGAPDGTVEVTRSAEQLRVSTQTVPVGRMRVRKRIVTEEQTVTVQVRREEFVLEPVAASAADPHDEPTDYTLGTQQSLVMVLYTERPVVSTEVVPVERVTVHVDVTTASQVVAATVRHEEVAVDHHPQASPQR